MGGVSTSGGRERLGGGRTQPRFRGVQDSTHGGSVLRGEIWRDVCPRAPPSFGTLWPGLGQPQAVGPRRQRQPQGWFGGAIRGSGLGGAALWSTWPHSRDNDSNE